MGRRQEDQFQYATQTCGRQADMCNRLRKKSFWRLLTPSLADVFFVALLLAAFLRPGGLQALLADGDTGWHIRTGQLILASGSAPSVDPYRSEERRVGKECR